VYYRLIDGAGELLRAADQVLEQAGENVGACPRYDCDAHAARTAP
jgi:hypothetical protein